MRLSTPPAITLATPIQDRDRRYGYPGPRDGEIRSKGQARRLVEMIASDPSHALAVSAFILAEVGKALSYPQMQTLLAITSDEIEDHVAYLRRVSRVVEPSPGIPVVLTDPQDDRLSIRRSRRGLTFFALATDLSTCPM